MTRKKTPVPDGVTGHELGQQVGVSRDTVLAWIDRGLLPPVPFRGGWTRYGAGHQLRARVIVRLRGEGVSYDEIARLLAVSDAELAARYEPPPAPPAAPDPTTLPPGAPTWRRVELLPGLELHVATGASEFVVRVAAEVIARYRAVASGPAV